MARLTTSGRKSLPKNDFALPKSAGSGKAGKGSYPIPDAAHARNALARGAQNLGPSQLATVKAKVAAKFPAIKQGPGARKAMGEKESATPKVRMSKPAGPPADHDGFMSLGHNRGAWK
jgi:hypothetical protein